MTALRALAIACVVLAVPASAQQVPFKPEATEACLSAAEVAPEACIGASAGVCMDTPDGYTTVGMTMCLGAELDYWDGRLNASYGELMDMEKAAEAELQALGSAAPSPAEALRDMQRAWIGYRDGRCLYERSQWGGGTGGGPAYQDCAMRMTGAQALMLEAMVADRRMR